MTLRFGLQARTLPPNLRPLPQLKLIYPLPSVPHIVSWYTCYFWCFFLNNSARVHEMLVGCHLICPFIRRTVRYTSLRNVDPTLLLLIILRALQVNGKVYMRTFIISFHVLYNFSLCKINISRTIAVKVCDCRHLGRIWIPFWMSWHHRYIRLVQRLLLCLLACTVPLVRERQQRASQVGKWISLLHSQ